MSKTASAERQPTRWTRRRLALAALAVFAAGLVAAALDLRLGFGSRPVAVVPDTLLALEPSAGEARGRVHVGKEPRAVAVGLGSVWVGNTADHTISRVDPVDLASTATIALPDRPSDVAIGLGSVLVPSGEAGSLTRIDPGLNISTADVPVCGGLDERVAVGDASVWLACGDRPALVRIEGDSARRVPIAAGQLSAVAFGEGALWITDRPRNRLVGIDPATGRPFREVTVGIDPVAVAVGFGSVWVANEGNASVTRVDAHGTKVEAIGVGDQPVAIAAGEGAVWVANRGGSSVTRIDPRDNGVTDTTHLESPPAGIAAGAGGVWVTISD